MPGIVPTFELYLLGELGVFALRTGRIGVSAICANQAVHHELERRRDLIPVHGRDDHDSVRGDPHWIDLVHAILRLTKRIARIAGTRPMTERRRRGEAGFARVDVASVLGSEAAEVE